MKSCPNCKKYLKEITLDKATAFYAGLVIYGVCLSCAGYNQDDKPETNFIAPPHISNTIVSSATLPSQTVLSNTLFSREE